MRPSRRIITAQLHADAVHVIEAAASTAHPRETGGLLLGWWRPTSRTVVVRDAAEVIDPDATTSSWARQERLAQQVLQTVLDDWRHPWLGYVGDWHSHPAAVGPSRQDERSIRRASRQFTMPILLAVRRLDGRLDCRGAEKGKACVVMTDNEVTSQADQEGAMRSTAGATL